MRRIVSVGAMALASAACADPPSLLLFPPEVLDGSRSSAIVFLQSSQALEAEVLEAELISFPPAAPLRFALDDLEDPRFRLFVYASGPDELGLPLGKLERALPGEGLPLPVPDATYLSASLTDPELTWRLEPDINMSTFPWRQPGELGQGGCADAHTQAWRIPGLELVQPRAILPIDENELILAGQWSDPSGGPAESLLIRLRDLDSSPRFEDLAPRISLQSHRDVIRVGDRTILTTTNGGWVTRISLDGGVQDSRRVLPMRARWLLSRGDDDTIVAFDAQDEEEGMVMRRPPHWLNPETLEVSPLDAPEVLRFVSVVTAEFMIAAGDRTLYRFESGTWTPEHALEFPVTELERHGDRFVALVGRGESFERDPNGEWRFVPNDVNLLDLQVATFLPDGRFVAGGSAGFLAQYHEGTWCMIPRALSRAIRAIGPVDEHTALAATYSQTVGELVGITRLTFDP